MTATKKTSEITREFAVRAGMSRAAVEEFATIASVFPDGEIWCSERILRMVPADIREEIVSYGSSRVAGDMEIFGFGS